jgi:hypothetical protein
MGSKLRLPRILGVVAWLSFLGSFSSNSFAIDDQLDGSVVSHATDPCAETSSPGPVQPSARPIALSEAIHQNTRGNSQGYPAGLSWDTGVYGTTALRPAPSGFSALTAWAVVYPEAGAPANAASVTVQVANFTTYVHLTNGTWVKVQDQRRDGVSGAHYVADFSNADQIRLNQQTLSDGSVSMDAPPAGYNDHFWPSVRGTFTPGTVDGVFAEAKMKTNDPNASLVAQIGADWWLNSTAQYVSDFKNNPVVGGNNFIRLTTQWQALYYTSLSPQELEANPPPDLLSSSRSCQ